MFSTSTLFATLSTTLFMIAYLFISYYAMELYNLWIPVVMPIIAIALAFTLSLLAKYLMKSRDFEYQYKLATIDGLTELYNHRYFQDTLRNQIELSKRYQQPFSLIIIDIDFFKKFNDTYGHQAGDAVLRQVAQTLKRNSRTTDFVCRYGGEEMSIILPNTGAEEALFNANRICKAVSEKEFFLNEKTTANVTISVGVATFPDNAQEPQSLIEYADKCLYYAKEHGRNQVGIYSDKN
jgi:diguanylate cyclase (GGDEF)-like protein